MKKTMINSGKKVMLLFTMFSLSISTALFAGNPGTIKSAELKFVGNYDKYPTFRLELKNTETAEFQVVVKDGDKEVLMTEKLKGEQISRVYKLDATDLDMVNGTSFEVTNLTTNETRVFKVSKTYREVVDVIVSN